MKAITSKLLKMITVDLQPASVVENQGFQEFVRELDSRHVLPSKRSLMRTDIPQLFENAQATVKSCLAEVNDITMTIDL